VKWQGFDAKGYVVVCSTGKAAAVRTAAPDMLSVLEECESVMSTHPAFQASDVRACVRATIAKATGGA
jgi:hypothetical protein